MDIVHDFLQELIHYGAKEDLIQRSCDVQKMKDIANFIESEKNNQLPGLGMIAQKYNVSISTLKRHFKAVHKKNIYEYYLHVKFLNAKELLNKGKNVSEVASELGYNKINSFSKIYKKIFGLLPSEEKQINDIHHFGASPL